MLFRSISRLNPLLGKVMSDRDMQDRISGEGAEAAPGRPEEFGKLIASELAVWAKVIKASNVKQE